MTAAIVVIGPSGNGKSTLASALAGRLEWDFIEGDEHHPPANIAKMARGEPLTDTDRAPFLDSIGRHLASSIRGVVASCSALSRKHRDHLRRHYPEALFIWAIVPPEELLRRLENRDGHFMPTSLLESQIAAFEPPAPDENAMKIDGCLSVDQQIESVLQQLGLQSIAVGD